MNWKELFKPNFIKITVFLVLFIFSAYIPTGYFKDRTSSSTESLQIHDLGLPLSFYEEGICGVPTVIGQGIKTSCPYKFNIISLIIDLIFWYLISALIAQFIIGKINKKYAVNENLIKLISIILLNNLVISLFAMLLNPIAGFIVWVFLNFLVGILFLIFSLANYKGFFTNLLKGGFIKRNFAWLLLTTASFIVTITILWNVARVISRADGFSEGIGALILSIIIPLFFIIYVSYYLTKVKELKT